MPRLLLASTASARVNRLRWSAVYHMRPYSSRNYKKLRQSPHGDSDPEPFLFAINAESAVEFAGFLGTIGSLLW
jgi:hypothetical protein